MFAVEAKKRYAETVGRPSKQSVADLRPIVKAKARDQAADVCGGVNAQRFPCNRGPNGFPLHAVQ